MKFDEYVTPKFENDIMHNGERYITKLPLKSNFDSLPDNCKICENRLNKLKVRLSETNF